jgi:uncharacterized radical SAM protein YgiQ
MVIEKEFSMFLPTTQKEATALGWKELDVILITGDSYIDSAHIGVVVVGKVLVAAGFRVGIIAQPDVNSGNDIKRMGEPLLFWGVSGGCVDSMVSNYTATGKRRKNDDFTPGGLNTKRPDRAVIAYTNLIRKHFKDTCPIILGGIEASLRRISHYDFWSNKVRRSILFDAKADYLIYGMAEETVVKAARQFRKGKEIISLPGVCYKSKDAPEGYLELPDHQIANKNKKSFIEMFKVFYENTDAMYAKGLYQKQDSRYLIQNPPPFPMDQQSLDAVYEIDFHHAQHPYYEALGQVRALETIKFSITTHRGCYGECHFCAIGIHQGRTIQWRSEASVIKEINHIAELPGFKGNIQDIGGPTANMYGFECEKKLTQGICKHQRCIFPKICSHLKPSHRPLINLMHSIRQIPKIKKSFVRSGLRYDLVLADKQHGIPYLRDLVDHHVSGQMKIAPEHSSEKTLRLMGKQNIKTVLDFKNHFDRLSKKCGKKQFLTYYFIAAHPGCTLDDMHRLKRFSSEKLKINPEQVQVFTPTPSTYSSLMYYTGIDPFTGEKIFVEKTVQKKEQQKSVLIKKRIEKKRNFEF